MLRLTKIFTFETAHAIYGYTGACKNIHGHSYELHVTVASPADDDNFLTATGIAFDFKEIKQIVGSAVIRQFDHKLILSARFLAAHPAFSLPENLLIWENEPTAENILIYIKKTLCDKLPPRIRLVYLKLYETKDSYAELIINS